MQLVMDQSNQLNRIQSTSPFHSDVSAEDHTNDMNGCAPHLGRTCVQSEGCNVYTPPFYKDDLFFSEFGSKFELCGSSHVTFKSKMTVLSSKTCWF